VHASGRKGDFFVFVVTLSRGLETIRGAPAIARPADLVPLSSAALRERRMSRCTLQVNAQFHAHYALSRERILIATERTRPHNPLALSYSSLSRSSQVGM